MLGSRLGKDGGIVLVGIEGQWSNINDEMRTWKLDLGNGVGQIWLWERNRGGNSRLENWGGKGVGIELIILQENGCIAAVITFFSYVMVRTLLWTFGNTKFDFYQSPDFPIPTSPTKIWRGSIFGLLFVVVGWSYAMVRGVLVSRFCCRVGWNITKTGMSPIRKCHQN